LSKKRPAQECDECGLGSRLGEEVHSTDCQKNKVAVIDHVRVNAYAVISRAVEDGIPGGYRRAFKHNDNPTEDQIFESIRDYVMNEICDVLQFGDEDE
jgi:hypothetical protein